MFENPRRGRQARNFTKNVPKILDLKSSSKQIFSQKLTLGAHVQFEIQSEPPGWIILFNWRVNCFSVLLICAIVAFHKNCENNWPKLNKKFLHNNYLTAKKKMLKLQLMSCIHYKHVALRKCFQLKPLPYPNFPYSWYHRASNEFPQ